MTNLTTLRKIRLGAEAAIGLTLIILAIPAIAHAFRTINFRVIAGLFVFVALFAITRDPLLRKHLNTLFRNQRSQNNGL